MQSNIQVSGGEIIFVNYIIQYRPQCSISKQCLVFAQHHLLGFYAAGQTHLADQPTGHCGQMNTVDERKYGLVLEKPRAALMGAVSRLQQSPDQLSLWQGRQGSL